MDRRTSIKWMLAASALMQSRLLQAGDAAERDVAADQKGYGTDPDVMRDWKVGEPWPLTLSDGARATASALADLIIPADAHGPAASDVGIVDFLDEWVSAPYPQQRNDRAILLPGLLWIEAESQQRFGKAFSKLTTDEQSRIADDICSAARSKPEFADAAKFFAKFRDLTAGGYYSTPVGWQAIGYVGNVALEKYDGPPAEVLKKVGLA